MHVHLEAVSLFITNGAEKRVVEERPRVRFLFTSKDDPLRKWINVLKILVLPMREAVPTFLESPPETHQGSGRVPPPPR